MSYGYHRHVHHILLLLVHARRLAMLYDELPCGRTFLSIANVMSARELLSLMVRSLRLLYLLVTVVLRRRQGWPWSTCCVILAVWQGSTAVLAVKPAPLWLRPPEIWHVLARDQTRTAAVISTGYLTPSERTSQWTRDIHALTYVLLSLSLRSWLLINPLH